MLAIFCIFHEFVNFRKYFPPPLDLFFSHFSAIKPEFSNLLKDLCDEQVKFSDCFVK